MADLLTRALMREFPGTSIDRLLLEHPMARLTEEVKSARYVVIPTGSDTTVYYAYRQGSLHRLSTVPLAFRTEKGTTQIAAA